MGWNFYNASGELQINDGGVSASAAVFTGNVDLGSNLLVGNAGSTGIAISANGEVTMAAQPAFLAGNSSTDSNQTGGGTTYTVDFDAEVFDQNADFASDTFTAPVTGKYCLNTTVLANGVTTSETETRMQIVTSNNTFECRVGDQDGKNHNLSLAILADMDAADTATVTIRISNGSDVVDIYGASGTFETQFGGFLVA